MTGTVTLEPMSAERFESWIAHLSSQYAQDKVDAGQWAVEGAVERATSEQAALLPRGVETPAHGLFVGTVDGQEVGVLWLFTDPALPVAETFIYDIEIGEDQRGKGYGRGLLEAAEGWCADHGVAILRLHVFDHNPTAINLYETAGFETTSRNMSKIIR